MNLRKLLTFTGAATLAVMPVAAAQNPTILQGSYVSNVFGQSNFVKNPNAQTNTANVTLTTATATRSTTTPLVATSEYNVTITSANGTVAWATRSFDAGMKNQNCEARFTYRGFQATSKAQIKQGANVVAELVLTPSATDPRIASINFPCGDLSSATTFVITDTATLAGTNEIGGIYVGLATNQANVAQAELVGKVLITGCSTYWQYNNNNNYEQVPTNAPTGCNYNASGSASAPSTNRPGILFSSLPPGNYQIVFNATMLAPTSTSAADMRVKLTDGTNDGAVVYVDAFNTQSIIQTNSTAHFAYSSTQSNIEFRPSIRTTSTASAGARIYADGTIGTVSIAVYRFPSSSELVVTPETQNVWGGVKWAGNADFVKTASGADTIVNTTLFGSVSTFGKANVASTTCSLNTNDIGMCLQNVPPGTYEITSNIEVGSVYNVGTPGINYCSAHIAVAGTSLSSTKTATAFAIAYVPNSEDWTMIGTGIVKIDSLQTNLSVVLKLTKSASVGGCLIRSANAGNQAAAQPTITFKPLDNNANSALYVQGPVKAAGTGAAIPSGYQGELRQNRASGCGTNAAFSDGASITITPGIWRVTANANLEASGTISEWLLFVGPQSGNVTTWRQSFFNDGWFSAIISGKLPTMTPPIYVRYDGTNLYRFEDNTWKDAYASATGTLYAKFYRNATCISAYTSIVAERVN